MATRDQYFTLIDNSGIPAVFWNSYYRRYRKQSIICLCYDGLKLMGGRLGASVLSRI